MNDIATRNLKYDIAIAKRFQADIDRWVERKEKHEVAEERRQIANGRSRALTQARYYAEHRAEYLVIQGFASGEVGSEAAQTKSLRTLLEQETRSKQLQQNALRRKFLSEQEREQKAAAKVVKAFTDAKNKERRAKERRAKKALEASRKKEIAKRRARQPLINEQREAQIARMKVILAEARERARQRRIVEAEARERRRLAGPLRAKRSLSTEGDERRR